MIFVVRLRLFQWIKTKIFKTKQESDQNIQNQDSEAKGTEKRVYHIQCWDRDEEK